MAENAAATSVALPADDIAALNTLTSTGVHGARYSRQQMALVDTAPNLSRPHCVVSRRWRATVPRTG
ncbi:hypothetical protein [Streptomyces angustmyceticus]|uniref:hypothetical protein n=1 Tax=Streptomyces angustmyceticus TaxID=285578 RepID=UPI003D923A2D